MHTSSMGKVYQTGRSDKDAIQPKATTTGIILYSFCYNTFWDTYNTLCMCLFACPDTLISASSATTPYDQPHEQPVVASSRVGTQGTYTYVQDMVCITVYLPLLSEDL